VINRGFSGWNTANAMDYFERIFPAPTDASPKLEYLVGALNPEIAQE
jgi:hypothetical protein